MRIGPDETDLVGQWIKQGNRVIGDAVEERISELVDHHLKRISVAPESGGWETLFRDPEDGRYWELTYPHGNMHGGGPQRLTALSKDAAIAKYRLKSDSSV